MWQRLPRSIGAKLLLAFLVMSALTAGLGLWGLREIDLVSAIGAETYDRPLMAINYARSADTMFEQLGNEQLKGKLFTPDGDDPEQSFFSDLDIAEQRASSPAAVRDVRDIRQAAQAWLDLRQNPAAAPADVAKLSDRVRAGFDRLIEQMAADGFANRQQATAATRLAGRLSAGLTLVALVISLLMSVLLSRKIVRPLADAAAVADRIAGGEMDTPIPPGGADEAGILLASMSLMQQRLKAMMAEEAARRRSAQGRLIEALESSTEAMILLDAAGHVLIANSRVEELLGPLYVKTRDGGAFRDIFAEPDAGWATRLGVPGEVQLPDGRWLHIGREQTVDGGAFLIWSDVTLRKSYERKLEIAAYDDPLTGVKNRAFMAERHDREIGAALDHLAILVLNIDRFRHINNAHGPRNGDAVLVALAAILTPLVTDAESIARTGGDEFVLRLIETPDAGCETLAAAILAALKAPLRLVDRDLTIHVSIGMARVGVDTKTGNDLVRDARAALDHAKRAGGDRVMLFNEAMRLENQSQLQIEADLEAALRDRQIYLDYQPLIDLRSGRIGGFEALARWRHPVLGQIPPGKFIPIAEENGAIVDLGRHVLAEAARQAEIWYAAMPPGTAFTVAINLSPRQVIDPRNARAILDFLDGHTLIARHLKLEVTEGVLHEDPAAMLDLLRELKGRGVELSLDDFGTGYSSLSYLHKFPFDVLKIDRSFVTGIADNADALRLVRTIVELGQDLGLTLVAEGVETAEQAARLKDLGCDFGQGYFYSRPVSTAAATALLAEQRAWV